MANVRYEGFSGLPFGKKMSDDVIINVPGLLEADNFVGFCNYICNFVTNEMSLLSQK